MFGLFLLICDGHKAIAKKLGVCRMNTMFTFRLSISEAESLAAIAKRTHRSRAGVIRWLLAKAEEEFRVEQKKEIRDTIADKSRKAK